MNAPPPRERLSEALLETAMMWRQRVDAPDWDAAVDAELEAWLQADERHAEAFARTGALFDFLDQHAAAPEMIAARRALLGRAQKVVRQRVGGRGRFVPMPTRRMAAALIGMAALAGAGVYPLAQRGDIYSTDRGERRIVTLEDGSRVSLDAESKLQVKYADDARRLRLIKGQARFDVAKDVSRPFSVRARDRTIVATGTAFNIDILDPKVKVTLIEGRVLVLKSPSAPALLSGRQPGPKRPAAVELRPGQQLVAPQNASPQVVAAVNVEEATAWQRGKLMFDQEPLADAVAKVNRYAPRNVRVEPEAASVPVSGVFEAGDTNGFLEAITGFLPVSVVDGPGGVTIRAIEGRG